MKYEKPLVMDLSARSVDGANHVDVCFPGTTATGQNGSWLEDCVGGGTATGTCDTGNNVGYPGYITCSPGSTNANACYTGSTANYMCNPGAGVTNSTPDFGCTSGPGNVYPAP